MNVLFIISLFAQYQSEDLEILYEQRNYAEFFEHIADIRPSQRDEAWDTMITTMALEYIDQYIEQNNYDLEFFKKIEELSTLPVLQNVDFYNRRINYARVFFSKCYDNEKEKCLGLMNTFWNSTDYEYQDGIGLVLFDLAKKLNTDSYPYLSRLVKDTDFDYCTSSSINTEMQARILKMKNPTRESIYEEASLACVGTVLASFKKDTSPEKLKILELFDQIPSSEDREIYLTKYILNDPTIGQTFNEAWKQMEDLGQNYNKRADILKKIEKEYLLPGKTFAISDTKKRDVLLNLIADNFPEYITLYTKKCLEYMQGIGEFPKGNPTLECRDLFANENARKWISSVDVAKFKNLDVSKTPINL